MDAAKKNFAMRKGSMASISKWIRALRLNGEEAEATRVFETEMKPRIVPKRTDFAKLLWRPNPAPYFTLKDGERNEHTLNDYKGKPVLLVFYLGEGCAACREQLTELTGEIEAFERLGISILGISKDSPAEMASSVGATPFPLVGDENGEVFRKFGAYDDFEDMALHGVFLIDRDGFIRWSEVSAKPLRRFDFLKGEAARLLID